MMHSSNLFSAQISAYEILYAPWQQVANRIGSLFAEYFPHGYPDFSNGASPLNHAMPILRRVKTLGYFPKLMPHPAHKMKCCILQHTRDNIEFEANGLSTEEAILRASALAFLAHRCRKTA